MTTISGIKTMRIHEKARRALVALATAVLLAGVQACESLNSPNENFGDLDDLVENPTPGGVNSAIQGLMVGRRAEDAAVANDVIGNLGLLGRESYTLDLADPRFETEMLGGDLNAASAAFGGNHWGGPYANIRLGDIALNALDQLDPQLYSDAEKEWARGFIKTMNALDLLIVVLTRDTNCGCPIDVPEGAENPAPAVGRDQVYQHVISLLDEGLAHLGNASGGPPFRLTSGFAGFDDAAGFAQFNRAIRARVAVYLDDWSGALTALGQSFLDTGASLDLGVYHVFTTIAGDITNGLFEAGTSPNLRAHPTFELDAELQGDGTTPDDRFVRKTRPIENRAYQGLCTDQSEFPSCTLGIAVYPTPTARVPIIRNEELILLRAEANIGLGNLAQAEMDINLIRAESGNLPPATLTSQSQALDQLLYEKRYSLFFEGGHRWIDMRHYGRLDQLPTDLPAHSVAVRYPVPLEETSAGGG